MRTAPGTPRVHIFGDAEELARAAARRFSSIAAAAQTHGGSFGVALAGGSTPKRVYELLAGGESFAGIDWPRCHIFFGDERCVPPDDARSNYRMANAALLSRVPVSAENVHRVRGEGDAVAGARAYEDELREFFGPAGSPDFDLVLLGMGEDGHTASLFPHSAALEERTAWVAANWVEGLKEFRITLTAPAINSAREILFMVSGSAKAEALSEVINGERDPRRLPAQLIHPPTGRLHWFVDEAAAAKL